MSRNALEASARSFSLCFSKAIGYELNSEIEIEEAVPVTVNFHDGTSDNISDAITWELERTFKDSSMSGFDGEDECKRFALTLSEDEFDGEEEVKIHLPASAASNEMEELKPKSRTPKRAQRSLYEKKRAYVWHKPLKNQGNRIRQRELAAKLANEKANANAKKGTDKQDKTSPSQPTRDVLDDDVDIDELFEDSDDEEVIMLDDDTEDEAEDSTEDEEDELFIPRKKIRTTPPSNTRQLVNLVRKNIEELSDLAVVSPGKPENIPGYDFTLRLRLAMDKVRYDEAGDLAPEEIVTLHEALAQLEEN